jgi:hypothetical protein
MRQGWHGESRRHAKAARLGWNRRLRAGGQRLRFLGHIVKKGGKKVKRAAEEAVRETKEEWSEATVKTVPGARRVRDEWRKFKSEEDEVDDHMDRDLEDTDYTYVHGHIRKKPSS